MNKLLEYIKDGRKMEVFIADNKDMLIKVAVAVLLVVAAFFIFVFHENEEADVDKDAGQVIVEENESTQKAVIYVDIGGEVANPMVVELTEGSRVEDAIEAAGGVTEKADLTDINRAAFVEDGEKVFIPTLPALLEGGADGTAAGDVEPFYSDDRININTADAEELQQLNGIGPATAEKIISYREDNGRFSAIEDIMNVSGIGEKTFEKFSEDIKV